MLPTADFGREEAVGKAPTASQCVLCRSSALEAVCEEVIAVHLHGLGHAGHVEGAVVRAVAQLPDHTSADALEILRGHARVLRIDHLVGETAVQIEVELRELLVAHIQIIGDRLGNGAHVGSEGSEDLGMGHADLEHSAQLARVHDINQYIACSECAAGQVTVRVRVLHMTVIQVMQTYSKIIRFPIFR